MLIRVEVDAGHQNVNNSFIHTAAAGEIAGRFAGFIGGGPLIVGRAGLKLAAKPFIKAAGREVPIRQRIQ